jgi:hypothetical protein
LYHELNTLDRFEQEYNSMLKGKDNTYRFEKGMMPGKILCLSDACVSIT